MSHKLDLCLTKGHLDNPEGQVEVESSLIGSSFLISFIDIKKKKIFFFKKGTFNEASDLWMLYLSKIGPAIIKKKIDNTEHQHNGHWSHY